MTTSLDYALLAGAAYFSNRNDINRFPIPTGWSELIDDRREDPATGFEARAFRSGSEIVISYAGTDFTTKNPLAPDQRTNGALGIGTWSPQLLQAAEYYLQVKAANSSVPVTLTGHSLGGGLAALVGVFFGVPAKTFDQAPFAASAGNLSTNAARLKTELAAKLNPDGSRLYSDSVLTPLNDYIALLPGNLSIPRTSLVDTIRVDGELLDGGLAGYVSIGNTSLNITHGTGAGSIDLHSQALLTSFLQSTASATANGDASKSLSEVSKKIVDLLALFFDSKLFSRPTGPRDPERNFLEHLVRHEAGVRDPVTGVVTIAADAMLTRFTKDLWKIAQPGGLSLTDANLAKALSAFAMQKYYDETTSSAGYNQQLFSDVSGGIKFDIADVATKFAKAFADNKNITLADGKGFDLYFTKFLEGSAFSPTERKLIQASLIDLRDWYVQSGGTSLGVTDTLNRGALMLGGTGSDALTGGSARDVLVGNAGSDTLKGGGGNDLLLGGQGSDTYTFSANFGKDQVLDSDGQGSLQIDGATLTGGKGAGVRNVWIGKDSAGVVQGYAVYDDKSSSTGKKLIITRAGNQADTITIDNFDLTAALGSGYLGIKLDPTKQLALIQGNGTSVGAATPNVWADVNFVATSLSGKISDITEGTGKTFTLQLNQGAKAGDTITLAASGLGSYTKAVLGDTTVIADGAVITLTEGQTVVSFALIQEGSDLTADANGTLTATYGSTGGGGGATSNAWAVNLKDAGQITRTFTGDQRPKLLGVEIYIQPPDGSPLYNTYFWNGTNWETDGTLTGGLIEANFSDGLVGTAGRDKIDGLGGNDALSGGGGNDEIDGGTGDDLIGGGQGSDKIMGGDGNDFINSSADLFTGLRKYPSNTWQGPFGKPILASGALWGIYTSEESDGFPVTTWDGSAYPGGTDSDFIDAGDGNDHVIAGGGDDRVKGGAGDDGIVGMGGGDVLEGGDGKDFIRGDGINKPGYFTSMAVSLHGADFIDGGLDDDTLEGQGGADIVFGGAGKDFVYGDSGGKTDEPHFYTDPNFHGADYLDGEDGDDYIEGGGKDDTLYGGDGADNLWGDTEAVNIAKPEHNALIWGKDYLDGEGGNDSLTGGGSDDTLYGGAGADALWGDESSDKLEGQYQGSDFLDGGEGNDYLVGGGKDDILLGGAGNDQLSGDDEEDKVAISFHGSDYLDGGDGDDILIGGGGADILIGGAGADQLDGGKGADYLEGGAGDDIYFVDSDEDVIVEEDAANAPVAAAQSLQKNTQSISQNITPNSEVLVVSVANATNAATSIGETVFSSITYTLGANLENLGLTGFEAIDGTGNSLNNGMFGGDGANKLSGAGGNDYLDAGKGDDVYIFNRGDGQDTIKNRDFVSNTADPGREAAVDTLRFGDGIAESDILGFRQDDSIVFRIKGSDEYVFLADYYKPDDVSITGTGVGAHTLIHDYKIDRVQFASGAVWNKAMIQAVADRATNNQLPQFTGNVPSLQTRVGTNFTYTFAATTITDPDSWDSITYSALMANGSALPAWLSFDAASRTLSGTPAQANIGNLQFMLRGTDDYGASLSQSLTLTVAAASVAPVLVTPLVDQAVPRGSPISYTIPANAFTDADAGDVLTYSATLVEGGALPTWLVFNAQTRSFSGASTVAGTTSVRVAATDSSGLTASDVFNVVVSSSAPVLVLPLADQSISVGSALSYTIPANAFTDADLGDVLTYSALQADGTPLPSWLVFNAQTRSLSGTSSFLATTSVRVVATDESGLTASDVFDIVVRLPGSGATEGNDTLTGGLGSELIRGFGGDDVINGGGGTDTLWGGSGDDTLIGDSDYDDLYGEAGNDTLIDGAAMNGGAGQDTYKVSFTRSLYFPFNGSIFGETGDGNVLIVTGSLKPSDFSVAVRPGSDDLILTSRLDGATLVISGQGTVHGITPPISEVRFESTPGTVWTAADLKQMALTGDARNNRIWGYSSASNTISGGEGQDSLYGGNLADTLDGGAGADYLEGGLGNDTYLFGLNSGADRIKDVSATGGNIIQLQAGVTVANLQLVRTGRTGADAMATNDSLVLLIPSTGARLWIDEFFQLNGNSTVSEIRFADGSGTVWTYADIATRAGASQSGILNSQTGTAANDTFIVDHVNDLIVEAINGGIDTVQSATSYTLPDNVENLTLVGALAVNGYGNQGDNILRGNDAANILGGGYPSIGSATGTAGFDQYYGGKGDDVYYDFADINGNLRNASGTHPFAIFELADEGVDTLITNAFSVAMPENVERMIVNREVYSSWYTNAVYSYTGNPLNNLIDLSGSKQDLLSRAEIRIDGGAGNDTMISGPMYTTFVVDSLGDTVIQSPNGRDSNVESSVAFTLSAGFRGLSLTGTAVINGTGNQGDNLMDGRRNSSVNELTGLAGDDIYYLGNGDTVVEAVGGGRDTVVITNGYGAIPTTLRISDWANVESMSLTNDIGSVNLVGDQGNNTLAGSFGSNTIDGLDGDDVISNAQITFSYDNYRFNRLEVLYSSDPSTSTVDQLNGGNGNDTIYSLGGRNIVNGGSGDDTIINRNSSTVIDGGNGHDVISHEGSGYAKIDGGAGDDEINISGFAGVRLGVGSGNDLVFNNYPQRSVAEWLTRRDTQSSIDLAAETDASSLRFSQSGTDLVFRLAGSSDSITITKFFEVNYQRPIIDSVRLPDGTILTWDAIATGLGRSELHVATAGNDLLITSATNQTVSGGAGNDQLFGQSTIDQLNGGAGADRLYAGDGADQLTGGADNDYLVGGHGADTYAFSLGWGQDVIDEIQDLERPVLSFEIPRILDDSATDTITFDNSISVADISATSDGSNLFLTHKVTGDKITVLNYFFASTNPVGQVELIRFVDNTVWNRATVDQLVRTITGTAGDDVLHALSYSSSDVFGLGGNDSLFGGGYSDRLYGGAGNDVLSDDYGDNLLDGGDGADQMQGGSGNDKFVVDNIGDTVTDSGGGVDTVLASVTYVMGSDIEKLTLSGSAAVNGTGNALDNVLTGNVAANQLTGGAGNDTYVVDLGDTTIELAGSGNDTVLSSISWTLAGEVENLTLTGTSAVNGIGNASDNTIEGNASANSLSGGAGNDYLLGYDGADSLDGGDGSDLLEGGNGNDTSNGGAGDDGIWSRDGDDFLDGGTGADTMVGWIGNDTYVVDNVGDKVVEALDDEGNINTDAGVDSVFSSITYTLTQNVENLSLTGSSVINATGNALNNALTGNSAANTLSGAAGNDQYRYNLGGGADRIIETTGNDRIVFGAGITQAQVTATRTGSIVKLIVNGTDSISIDDLGGGTYAIEQFEFANGTVLGVTWVNSIITSAAPTATNLSAAEAYTEDTAKNLVDIVVTDTDSANVTVTLTLSNVAAGSLNVGTSGTVTSTFVAATGIWTASGVKANVNTLLAALTFTPAANFNANFSIATSVSDGVAPAITGSKAFTGTAVNDMPTGGVTISGTATQGQTLTAANTLADVDGLGSIAYQWKAAGVVIAGATASTFVLTSAQVGKAITVSASYTDGKGTAEIVASGATSLVTATTNAAPTATNLSTAEAYTEDTAKNLVDIVVADTDSANLTATLTLSNVAAGSLNVGTSGTVTSTYVAATGVWTASGATANVNTLLAALTFTPAANFNGNFTIATSVSDGVAPAVTGSKAFTGTAVNDLPTGSVTITGTATQGQTLTAANTLADVDGLGSIAYQWKAAGVVIAGATASTFVLTSAQVGKAITVSASYTDGKGTAESIASSATALVTATTNAAPTATNLSAAEAYTEDTAKNLVDIVVTDADSANVTVTLTLSNTAAGSLNVGTSGTVTSTYAAATGVWSASGAKANVNTLLAALTFTPATNFNGNFSIATSVSDGVAPAVTGSKAFTGTAVNDAPTGGVTITGTAAQGQTLTAANTLADVDGLGTITYQWKAAGVVIAGATASTFVLTSAQVGKAMTVSASYTDGKGTAESASSAATAAVVASSGGITGTAGADTITGTAGADQMSGLAGNDVYTVNNTGDLVIENLNEGTDLVNASISHTLANNVENLTLTGTAADGSGNALANLLTGNASANTLSGGVGNDTLIGAAGSDVMLGGDGDDTFQISGTDAGSDSFQGDAGADQVMGSAGDDTIRLSRFWGNYTVEKIDGGAGINVIATHASTGTDINFSATQLLNIASIQGGTGNDSIVGSAAADVIVGGAGSDLLSGGAADDIFQISGTDAGSDSFQGDAGMDVVQGSAGDDTIRLSRFWGNYTVERIDGGTGVNVIAAHAITGTELNFAGTQLVNIARIEGGAGNDSVTGSAAADVLKGGAGSDALMGGLGNDTYWLARGYGFDIITENDTTAGNTDIARFDTGIATDQLWFTKVGNNLDVSIIGTADKFTLTNWYLGNQYHVEQFKTSDGKTLLDSQVQNLVSAMAAFAPPAAGQTTLPANYATTLAPVLAANWV